MHRTWLAADFAICLRVLSSSHRSTRCSLSGSCPRIAQRSWAFRRRSPADPAVRPTLYLGAHAVSPAQLQRVETPVAARDDSGVPRSAPPGPRLGVTRFRTQQFLELSFFFLFEVCDEQGVGGVDVLSHGLGLLVLGHVFARVVGDRKSVV